MPRRAEAVPRSCMSSGTSPGWPTGRLSRCRSPSMPAGRRRLSLAVEHRAVGSRCAPRPMSEQADRPPGRPRGCGLSHVLHAPAGAGVPLNRFPRRAAEGTVTQPYGKGSRTGNATPRQRSCEQSGRGPAPPSMKGPARTLHGDLHPGNILLETDGSLAGVIDFGDVGAGDPAVDLAAGWLMFDAGARRSLHGRLWPLGRPGHLDEGPWLGSAHVHGHAHTPTTIRGCSPWESSGSCRSWRAEFHGGRLRGGLAQLTWGILAGQPGAGNSSPLPRAALLSVPAVMLGYGRRRIVETVEARETSVSVLAALAGRWAGTLPRARADPLRDRGGRMPGRHGGGGQDRGPACRSESPFHRRIRQRFRRYGGSWADPAGPPSKRWP